MGRKATPVFWNTPYGIPPSLNLTGSIAVLVKLKHLLSRVRLSAVFAEHPNYEPI